MTILKELINRNSIGRKSVSVLIDPDKCGDDQSILRIIEIANENYVDFFFVGGSLITTPNMHSIISLIRDHTQIPIILFPGSNMHIDTSADGILFLSLISGRNPDLLIGQHVAAAPLLKASGLEVLPTGYMLINSGQPTSASYMSNTTPIPADKYAIASSTALAGEFLGLRLIYLDAGSGGGPISAAMIAAVRKVISVPLIVGGGIDRAEKALLALENGADMIVIGNAVEKNPDLLIGVSEKVYDMNKALNIH